MLRRATLLLLFALVATTPAYSQGGGCVLVTNSPAQLRGVTQRIARIQDDNADNQSVGEKPKHFASALRVLDETDRIQNQIGRHYVTGLLYAAFLGSNAKGIKDIVVREDIGLFDNPKGMHDMYAAADSALNKVEALNAACVDSTAVVRYRIYRGPFNKARALMNAGKYDSAEAIAKRALVVDPKSGAPWNLIAEVRQRKGDTPGYAAALEEVVRSLSSDSTAKAVRQQALFNLAVINSNDAEKQIDDAKRVELARKAIGYFNDFLKLKVNDPQGRTALARALKLAGDSAQAYAIFKEMLVDPTRYTSTQLFSAGVDAFGATQYDDAIAFFEAGLKKNPYSRDGLFNLANSYVYDERYDLARAIFARLFDVDPLNRDNFILAAKTWQQIMNAAKDEAAKKVPLDSTLRYLKLRDSSEISVRPDVFTPPATGDFTFEGAVHNWTAAPKSFSFVVEFLNSTGAVVGSAQTIEVADIPAKTGKRFTLTGRGAGVVAYRYKAGT